MIKFRQLTVGDKDLVQSYTMHGDRQNCDLSIANLISWQFLYNTQVAVVDDYLVFRFYAGRHLAYMAPLPKPTLLDDGTMGVKPCDECSVNVIRAMREDSIAMGHPFLLLGVCRYMVGVIEKAFTGIFKISPERDYADYIYTREKLMNLSGKKLQSKRNHINKFKKTYPDYEYRDLTTDMIPQCIGLEKQWREKQTDEEQTESQTEELRSMTRAFHRWDALGLRGGTIWVDGKMVAFTYGAPINNSTFDVCVEKADTAYEGTFSIINQEFVSHLPENFIYVNREEDLGDEGLRFAKSSYHPDILLEKNVLMEKNPLAQFEDQKRIKKETRQLWKETFHDTEAFMELYFSRVYKSEYNVCSQIDGHVAGAFQAIPFTMLYHGCEVKTAYISGVSVKEECRKQDIGTNMMSQAHFDIFNKEAVFATLIPAEEWLYNWYGSLGYVRNITCTPPPDINGMTFEQFDELQRNRDCTVLHDSESFDVVKEDIRLAGADYRPAVNPVQAMVRVISALRALKLYAAVYSDEKLNIKVEDDGDIPANNTYYVVADGRAWQTDEPLSDARRMSIGELAEFVFRNEDATMTLMLN